MFDRRHVKASAREVLRKYYWLLFVVCLVLIILSGEGLNFNLHLNTDHMMNGRQLFSDMTIKFGVLGYSFSLPYILNYLGYIIISFLSVISVCFMVFVGNPLIVGCRNYIAHSCNDKQSFDDLALPFRKYYWNAVGTMFLMNLSIVLWGLLFVIPGIVKAYAYQFVPYLLEDEPNLSYGEILRKSADMTRGIKLDLFVLDISFFGWYLLNFITFGLANFFISPYVQTTKALVYLQIRNDQF